MCEFVFTNDWMVQTTTQKLALQQRQLLHFFIRSWSRTSALEVACAIMKARVQIRLTVAYQLFDKCFSLFSSKNEVVVK